MRPLFILVIFSLCFSTQLFAQGTITGISVFPNNPTELDDIEIHVNLQFTSGDCLLDNDGFSTNGNTITAYAHHCVGLLTVICPATDTFQIGQLAPGSYSFDFTLSSGFGQSGCSPGIVPDDNEQFQFTVSSSVGISEIESFNNQLFPNPVADILNFEKPLTESCILRDILGQKVLDVPTGTIQLNLSELSPGIYVLSSTKASIQILKN